MYEKPVFSVILFSNDDVIRTSNEWNDSNVDSSGWVQNG